MAANAAGTHPDTCRTRQLSLRALMVLYGVHMGEQTAASLDYEEREVVRNDGFPLFIMSLLCLCYVLI